MTNQEICLILNQYQYRNRTNWRLTIPVYACETNNITDPPNFRVEFISYPIEKYDKQRYLLDEFAAIAICEKLVKQSSYDDIILLSITQPLKDRIAELEKELLLSRQLRILKGLYE